MSSHFFKDKIFQRLIENGNGIPYDKWFVNLSTVGNVGAASVYLMVDELYHSGKLKPGDKILLLVPESASLLVYVQPADRLLITPLPGFSGLCNFIFPYQPDKYGNEKEKYPRTMVRSTSSPRKWFYVTDDSGKYSTDLSTGWEVKPRRWMLPGGN